MALAPLLWMYLRSVWGEEGFSLASYEALFSNTIVWNSFGNSLFLAFWVALATSVVGTILGFLFVKSDILFVKVSMVLLLTPLLVPPYIVAFAWYAVLGHHPLLFGFWGTFWVLFSVYLPIPMLMSMLFLRQIHPHLEEMASLYTDFWGIVKGVLFPLILPVFVFSFLLVFMLSFGEFSVANFLRYPVFSTVSFTEFSAFYDFDGATAATLPLVGLALVVMWILKKSSTTFSFKSAGRVKQYDLGVYLLPLTLLVVFLVGFIMIVPFGALIARVGRWESFVLAWDKAIVPLSHTLLYATLGASVLLFFGFLMALMLEKKRFLWLDGVLLFLFLVPFSVIAIGLIQLYNTPYTNFIYASPLILLFAYLAKYLFVSTKIVQAKLSQIPPSLREAAVLSGAGWFDMIRYILIGLSLESLALAWLVGFLFVLRESTMTMLLYPAGWESLSVSIFTLMANGNPEVIAGLCVIMIGMTLLPLAWVWWLWERSPS